MGGTPGHARMAGYGSGVLGVAAVEFFVRVYLLKLYTDEVGLSPAIAGAMLAVAALWDGVTDPVMGELSDRTRARAGRRRPWIAAGALLTAGSFLALFSPPALGTPAAKALYLLATYVVFNTALTVLAVPHAALGGELTGDPRGRTQVFGWRFLFTNVGLLVGILVPAVAAAEGGVRAGALWLAPAVVLGGAVAFLATRGRDAPDRSGARFSPGAVVRSTARVFRMRAFRPLLAAYVVGSVAMTLNSAVALFYYEHRLGLGEREVFLAVLLPFALVIALSIGGWSILANAFGRRRTAFLGVLALGIGTSVVYPFFPPGELLGPVLWAIAGGALVGSVFLLDATVADVVDLDEAVTGVHREGVYFGTWRMASKIARGGGLVLTGVLLGSIGFDAGAEDQSAATALALAWIFGPGVGALFVLAALLWLLVPMGKELRARVRRVLDRRISRRTRSSPASPSRPPSSPRPPASAPRGSGPRG